MYVNIAYICWHLIAIGEGSVPASVVTRRCGWAEPWPVLAGVAYCRRRVRPGIPVKNYNIPYDVIICKTTDSLPQVFGAPDARSVRCVGVGWSAAPPHVRRGREPPHTHMSTAGTRPTTCVLPHADTNVAFFPAVRQRMEKTTPPAGTGGSLN